MNDAPLNIGAGFGTIAAFTAIVGVWGLLGYLGYVMPPWALLW